MSTPIFEWGPRAPGSHGLDVTSIGKPGGTWLQVDVHRDGYAQLAPETVRDLRDALDAWIAAHPLFRGGADDGPRPGK